MIADCFMQLVLHWTMVEGVRRQMESFKEGFETLIPLSRLSSFYAEEVNSSVVLCCHFASLWSVV
jgi:E3 ubiquitin-protein ligase TRIP12